MKEIIRRTISLLLSFIMVLGVMPMNLLAGTSLSGNGSQSSSTVEVNGNGTNTGGYTTYNFEATGYKVQLIFIQMPDSIYMEEDTSKRKKDIKDFWNASTTKIRYDKDGDVKYIGNPVYLTKDTILGSQSQTKRGYLYSDFQYGIGNKSGSTGKSRSRGDVVSGITLNTPEKINKLTKKYKMSPDLPIYISEKGGTEEHKQRALINDYFLCKAKNEKGEETYYARENLASLVNFIANNGSTNQTTKILFTKLAQNNGTIVSEQTDENGNPVTGNEANVFDTGTYDGKRGEYRLIISPYVSISGNLLGGDSKNEVAVTLRDMYSLGSDCYSKSQPQYFKALAKAVYFDKDDFFEMRGIAGEIGDYDNAKDVAKDLTANYGIGIGLISSDMVRSNLGQTNIGSITHIFLDGDKVKTASMEYVGKKNEQTENTYKAILQATLQLAKASTDKNGVSTNAFINEALSSEVLLNGTIKIPTGIGESSSSNSLSASFEEFGNAVADKIEAEYKDTDGKLAQQAVETLVSENFGLGNTSKLKDIALGIYILNRFGMDGLDTSTSIENQYIENNITNKWKQILSYATLLANDKSRATIETGSGWKGAYSITADKLTKDTVYGSVPLDNTTYAKVGNAKTLAEAKTAGLDGENGQITVHNGKVLKDIIDGNDKLSDGFVRVPIAYGFNPLSIKHINTSSTGAIKEKTYVTMPKNWVGQMTEALFTQANTGNLLDGTTKTSKEMLSKADITSERQGVLYNYGGDTGLLGLQTQGYKDARGTQTNVLLSESNILNPVVTGKAFNPVYGKKVNSNAEVQSAYLNTFGINTYIAVGLARGFDGGYDDNNSAFQNVINELNGKNSLLVVPRRVDLAVKTEKGDTATASDYTNNYLENIQKMSSDKWVLNDAITANTGSNEGSLVLAVNNYILNAGLVQAQSSVGTLDGNNLGLQGAYGQSYVIWGKGMPVDALLTTEVDGKIVPLEIATDEFDSSVIPGVWTAVEGIDKLLNVNRYYTIKDKDGKEITLEVEEAVVKPATVNGANVDDKENKQSSYREFLDKYSEAVKENNTQDFAVYKTEDGQSIYTRRTIFDTASLSGGNNSNSSSNVTNNVDTYIKTHSGVTDADPWRAIIEDTNSEKAGTPQSIANLSASINNGLDVVATSEDAKAYATDNKTNRMGIVLKVKIKGNLNQYNMINKVDGTNETIKVAPETDGKGNYTISGTIATKNGYATLTPSKGLTVDENGYDKIKDVAIEFSNGADDPTATEETKNKSFEDYVTNTVLNNVRTADGDTEHPTIKRQGIKNVTAGVTGNWKPNNFTPSSIYVKYEEYPPVYEVYRSKTGTEVVVEKPQLWNNKGNLDGLSDGTTGTPDGGKYIPVSAVANNYDYNNKDFQAKMLEDMDGEKVLKTPTSWKEILEARKYTKRLNIFKDTTHSSSNGIKGAYSNVYDSQLIGEACETSQIKTKTNGTVDYNSPQNTFLNMQNLFTGDLHRRNGTDYQVKSDYEYAFGRAYKGQNTNYYKYNTGNYRVQRVYAESGSYSSTNYGYTTHLHPYDSTLRGSGNVQGSGNTYGVVSDGYYAQITSSLENSYYNTETGEAGKTDPTKYSIYILYVEDPSSEKNDDGISAFTYLPEDMITRAVSYKSLARQYFQRQQRLRYLEEISSNKSSNTDTKNITINPNELSSEVSNLYSSLRSDIESNNKNAKYSQLKSIGSFSLVDLTGNSLTLNGTANLKKQGLSGGNTYTFNVTVQVTGELKKLLSSKLTAQNGETATGCELMQKLGSVDSSNIYTEFKSLFSDYNVSFVTASDTSSAETDTRKRYYRTNFDTWYTLYINMNDTGAKRVNTDGIASAYKTNTENRMFETEKDRNNGKGFNVKSTANSKYDIRESGIEYSGELDGTEYSNWGLNGIAKICAELVTQGETTTTKEVGVTVYPATQYSGNKFIAGSMAKYGQVSFGMGSTSTPATVGTGEGFNNSKDYTSSTYLLHSDNATDGRYWRDVYHGYNNYNFYVMVWRGMDKPVLSSAAANSEQSVIANTQREALTGVNKIANVAIGTQGSNVNGFYSGTDIGIAPRDKKVQDKLGTSEKMYDTAFDLVWKNTQSPKDGNSSAINYLAWGYETSGSKHIHTSDVNGHSLAQNGTYTTVQSNGLTGEAPAKQIKGKLLVDTYTDAEGEGNKSTAGEDLGNLSEFNIKVSDIAYGSDKSELTFYGANANSYRNNWTDSNGQSYPLWINLYPFAKMRYQRVNQETGYSEKGSDGEYAVTTHDVYVTAKNQSTMLTNDCIDVGINNGVGVTATSPVSNLLKINSSQWSTHKRSISTKGAGNVLPGGAIYMLNTGSLSSATDGANRTKIGIRVWQTYLPETTRAMLVKTNRDRYGDSSSAQKELNAAKNFYSLSAKNSQAEGILKAAMITLNNIDVNLYANDNGTVNKLVGGGKYGLQSGQDYTKPSANYGDEYAGNSGYSEDGEVNENIKGNSASIDTTKLLRGEKMYYRVWSTGTAIMFGWLRSNQNTSPTIEQLSAYTNNITDEHGCLDITNWIDRNTGEVSTGTEDGHAIVYSVNKRTKIVTNFYKMLDLARDTGDGGSKPKSTTYDMPADNMADGNNMAYLGNQGNEFGAVVQNENHSHSDMWFGNGKQNVDSVETAKTLQQYKQALLGVAVTGSSTNSRLGASWVNQCLSLQGNRYYSNKNRSNVAGELVSYTSPIDKQEGWYGEACDGIGVVVSSAVIETGFALPIPTGTDTPVRTSIIDPTWTPKHTGNNGTNATYTVFREVFFQTNASSNLVGAVTTNGGYLSQGSVVTTDLPDNNDNGVLFNMIINGNKQKVRLGKDSNGNQIGFDRLYKSRKFYLPNATVMDLN